MNTCGDSGGINSRGGPCGVRVGQGKCRLHREGGLVDTAVQQKKRAFLESIRVTGNISASARETGIPRQSHYEWAKHDPAYASAYRDAEEEAADSLEAEARRRAVEGVTEPVGWFQGSPGGYVQRYSDTLLIFLLKGARPEKYRERHEVSGPNGGPIRTQSELTGLPLEELLARRQKLIGG